MNNLKCGLILACLILLSACASAPPLPEVQLIKIGCPRVTQCQLPASNPQNNGDLRRDVEAAESAWHDCAAQVDMVFECQQDSMGETTSTGSVNGAGTSTGSVNGHTSTGAVNGAGHE
jgi:hypothetical protein